MELMQKDWNVPFANTIHMTEKQRSAYVSTLKQGPLSNFS